ncbi:MAG: GGDEF domain-containing protein [Spirochaetales bacterium]|nr:GGDEF domain-containing protein [Spirochaetales bacterium]
MSVNNIYLIRDRLEVYENYFKHLSGEINFYALPFSELICVEPRIKAAPHEENNLIIIQKGFYNEVIRKWGSRHEFLKPIRINSPHFLFIGTDKNIENKTIERLFEEDDFFYLLSDVERGSNTIFINYFYLRLIFQCIENRKHVHDYIVTSFQNIVKSTIIDEHKKELESLYKELETVSRIDSLTGVLNREALFEAMDRERRRAMKDIRRLHMLKQSEGEDVIANSPLSQIIDHYGRFSCLMIDIDHFKQVNDTYGHRVGDNVLREFGKLLRSKLIFEENDLVGRYGGEEFVVLLPETSYIHARIPSDRLRIATKELNFKTKSGSFKITISIGVSEFHTNDRTCGDVIERADKALYYAKEHGRDTISIFEEIADLQV